MSDSSRSKVLLGFDSVDRSVEIPKTVFDEPLVLKDELNLSEKLLGIAQRNEVAVQVKL